MNRAPRSITRLLAGCAALALLIAVANLWIRPPAPLTATEKGLVGTWHQTALPGKVPLTGMTFAADRTFRSHDGQFIGRWWISSGQLHVKHWRVDWRDDWSMWRFADFWRALHVDTTDRELKFAGSRDRVELAEPGKPPDCALIRLHD